MYNFRIVCIKISILYSLGLLSACKKDNQQPKVLTNSTAFKEPYFKFNIIGAAKEKRNELNDEGARVFVSLNGSTTIWFQEGNFGVFDKNLTHGFGTVQLPNPDFDNDGKVGFSVFARPVGTPGGEAYFTLCATDSASGKIVCSNQTHLIRFKGSPEELNITKQVFYLFTDLNKDSVPERYPLFNRKFKNYHLKYDNSALKNIQIRFYWDSLDLN